MRISTAAWMLVLAVGASPALAQTSQPAPSSSQNATNPPQKPKKVWTNDDLTDLRGSGGVTTATVTLPGDAAAPADANAGPAKDKELSPEKDPKTYRAKLDPLRKQLADVDAKIKDIQDALANPFKGTNKISLTQPAPNMPPKDEPPNPERPSDALFGSQIVRPEDQLAVYQQKRQEIQDKIDDLESQARRNGINVGDLQ